MAHHLLRRVFQEHNARPHLVLVIYTLLAIGVSFQNYYSLPRELGGNIHTAYNNYLIFKLSFSHLVQGENIYEFYPTEHWDLFKYSPTFSILFSPLGALPDLLGLTLWNLLNALVLYWGIRLLMGVSQAQTTKVLLFVLVELATSLQNSQSNALIAGLIIGGFALMEREEYFTAIICLMATVFIKIFGIIIFGLLLFYPNLKRISVCSIVVFVIFFSLPLLVVSVPQLIKVYKSWWQLLANDADELKYCLSIRCLVSSWLNYEIDKKILLAVAFVPLVLPLLRWNRFAIYQYRVSTLCCTMLWLVIFNHKAESPTFIIAVSAAAVWYFMAPRSKADLALIILVYVFTTLAPTDIFPSYVRDEIFKPFRVKLIPCLILWVRILIEILSWPKEGLINSSRPQLSPAESTR